MSEHMCACGAPIIETSGKRECQSARYCHVRARGIEDVWLDAVSSGTRRVGFTEIQVGDFLSTPPDGWRQVLQRVRDELLLSDLVFGVGGRSTKQIAEVVGLGDVYEIRRPRRPAS